MRTDEDLLDEVEHANNGEGPDPIVSIDDPTLARVPVAQITLYAPGKARDRAVHGRDPREADHSWGQIRELLATTRRRADKRFPAAERVDLLPPGRWAARTLARAVPAHSRIVLSEADIKEHIERDTKQNRQHRADRSTNETSNTGLVEFIPAKAAVPNDAHIV